MNVAELINDKYIILKTEYGKREYWLKSACGYTEEIYSAAIYSKAECKYYGIAILTASDIKEKKHNKYVHYALPLELALKVK